MVAGETLEVTAADEPAAPGQAPIPRAFRWRGKEFRVGAVLRRWQDDPDRARAVRRPGARPFEAPGTGRGRTYFRVRSDDGSVFDLAWDPDRPQPWRLLRHLGGPGG